MKLQLLQIFKFIGLQVEKTPFFCKMDPSADNEDIYSIVKNKKIFLTNLLRLGKKLTKD